MKYAFVRNGVVESVEDCIRNGREYPIETLFHKDILPMFLKIPTEYEQRCWIGWRYDAQSDTWSEPVVGSVDPETGKMYVPKGMIENELRMILKNAEDITGVQIELVKSEQGQTEIMLQDRKE